MIGSVAPQPQRPTRLNPSLAQHLKSRLPRRVPAASTFHPNSQPNPQKMSTPPPPDLTSPISSPLPKRTKTAHDSSESAPINGTMASSAPAASVPVTKVQDGPHLLIKKLSDKAKLPTRGSAFAAGYDLYASKEATIPARGKGLVDTDLSMAVPAGTCSSPLSPNP